MQIDASWLDNHQWMLRTSHNGVGFDGYRRKREGAWNDAGDRWTGTPTCEECGGFFGITPTYNAFGLLERPTVELCEWAGECMDIDGDKICVQRYRVGATGAEIPDEAFRRCGYLVPEDGTTISPKMGERWIAVRGTVAVSGQSGGDCLFFDRAVCRKVSGQSGGECWFLDDAICDQMSRQSGGDCWFVDRSVCREVNGQSGGECWFHGHAICYQMSNQSGGECWFHGHAICDKMSGQSGGECWFYDRTVCDKVSGQSGGRCWFCGHANDPRRGDETWKYPRD